MSKLDLVHCVMRVKMKDEDEDDEGIGDDDDDADGESYDNWCKLSSGESYLGTEVVKRLQHL